MKLFNWKHFRYVIAYTQLIAVSIALGLNLIINWDFTQILITSLTFTNLISFSYTTLHLYFFRYKQRISGKLLNSAMVLCSTITGTYTSIFLLTYLLQPSYYTIIFSNQKQLMAFNLMVAILSIAAGSLYNGLKSRIAKEVSLRKELEILQAKSSLLVLQSKINPHFLFNTLNTINHLINSEPQRAKEIVIKLADLYRKLLNLPDKSHITLAEELEFIKDYLDIEKIRLGSRLNVKINCPEQLHQITIPPLILEPIVENAIIHGIAPQKKGGTLEIEVIEKAVSIEISVFDNGAGISTTAARGFGLDSVCKRLELTYNNRSKFKITAPETGGTRILLEIPYED